MHRKSITIYRPGNEFPSISITSTSCSLDCSHCGGHYLKHMIPAVTPLELEELCTNLWSQGKTGVLISGGCDPMGMVPLAPFTDTLKKIKEETGLNVNVHTGLLDMGLARGLASAGVDVVSFDMVGSSDTVERVYGIKKGIEDYQKSLDMLVESGVDAVPHICIGLDHGHIVGEMDALSILKERPLKALVFLVLIPTRGTKMAGVKPPSTEDVSGIISEARNMMPDVRILMGCMRPKRGSLDIAALESGIDGIAVPTREAVRWMEAKGIHFKEVKTCCVL